MMPKTFIISLVATVAALATNESLAGCQANAKSGAQTAAVVELYTSEGCDSCPPADKWFSTLRALPAGAAPVIPLAFHVDYWDYIGWKDRFANARYAERQRSIVAVHGGRTVYTPQIMLDGRDSRSWTSASRFDASLRDVATRAPRASIALGANDNADSLNLSLDVAIANEADRRDAQLYIAITENKLESRVTAGENRGVTLKHDHVVRELVGPLPVTAAMMQQSVQRTVRLARDWKREDLNVAAFVQNSRDGTALQAVSVSLCKN
jgi:hypothetical protein